MDQNYLPFPLGTTQVGLDDAGNIKRKSYEGQRFVVPTIQPTVAPRSSIDRYNGCDMEVVCLRNRSGVVLPGKRLVLLKLDVDGQSVITDVAGMANAPSQRMAVFTDPNLPAAGVPDGSLFWGVIKGITTVRCPGTTSDLNGDVAVGDPLMTAASGTGLTDVTLGGRISKITTRTDTVANAGADLLALVRADVGYSLTTRAATGSADVDILVFADCKI